MKRGYLLYTGFGKTKMCLDKIMKAPRKPRTLLISTKNVVETSWIAEINKWYPGQISYNYITGSIKPKERLEIINKPTDILAMNTEMIEWYVSNTCSVKRRAYLKSGLKLYYNEEEILDRFDLIIIDEVSLFKNSQSNRFKYIKKWCWKARNVMLLSATPTPKNIEDIWAETYLLDGGKRLGKSVTKFREEYAISIPLPNGMNRYQYSKQAVDEVLEQVQDLFISIPKPDKPLFPEPTIKRLLIKPDPNTKEFLEKFKKDYIIKLNNGENLIAFSKTQIINKVNQIASGSVYHKQQTVKLNNIKIEALKYKLKSINTPVLVVYTYKFDKRALLELPGAVLLDNPQAFADWNANKIKLGILSPFSAAHGLNLQDSDCTNIFWFSPIWDTEKWIQTNARVCRRGQRNKVTIYVLLLKGSYDLHAFDLCQRKYIVQYNNLETLR